MTRYKDDDFDYGTDPEIVAALMVPLPEPRDDYVNTHVPIVFINIDGVLNPGDPDITHYGKNCYPYRDIVRVHGVDRRIALNPEHGEALRGLREKRGAELVWVSTWNEYANDHIAGPLGLGKLPYVPLPAETWGDEDNGFKAVAALDWARGRPFVWFDDSPTLKIRLHHYETAWHTRRHSPNPLSPFGVGEFLHVFIQSAIGLRPSHTRKADRWLRDLRIKPDPQ